MAVLIGCSPSTGSSLLRRMLNRHPELFCGSETSLFAKQELYTDWYNNKSKLTRSSVLGLANAGWHDFIGVSIEEDYHWSASEFKKLVKKTQQGFEGFISEFYKPILKKSGKKTWVEKTPSNAFTLKLFLDNFPSSKAIHIVRNPLDAIASLHGRGMDLYNAVNVYLLNTAKALELKDDKRAHLIKYEDLVMNAESTLQALCDFLEVAYVERMIMPSTDEGGVTKMKGWKQEETAPISAISIGRFKETDSELSQEILSRIGSTTLSLDLAHRSIADIARTLDYALPLPLADQLTETLKKKMAEERKADIWKRHFTIAHFRKHNYPISIGD